MTLQVERDKGCKGHYAMLSPALLQRLRSWLRITYAQSRMLSGGWLSTGLNPTDPLTARKLNRAVHAAAETTGILLASRSFSTEGYCWPRHTLVSCTSTARTSDARTGAPARAAADLACLRPSRSYAYPH